MKTISISYIFIFFHVYKFLTWVNDDKGIKFCTLHTTSISTYITCPVTATLCPVTYSIKHFKYALDSGHILWDYYMNGSEYVLFKAT